MFREIFCHFNVVITGMKGSVSLDNIHMHFGVSWPLDFCNANVKVELLKRVSLTMLC